MRRSLRARGQVQEKEGRLRVMMRMMGLGTAAYWAINYAFWLLVYVFFAVVFSVVAAFVRLPSGYRIGLFPRQVPPTPRRRGGGGSHPHRGGARGVPEAMRVSSPLPRPSTSLSSSPGRKRRRRPEATSLSLTSASFRPSLAWPPPDGYGVRGMRARRRAACTFTAIDSSRPSQYTRLISILARRRAACTWSSSSSSSTTRSLPTPHANQEKVEGGHAPP